VSNKTEQKYDDISLSLIERYTKETGKFWREDAMSLCIWILSLSKNWSTSTWRLRKIALANYMARNGPIEAKLFFLNASKIKKLDDANKIKKTPKLITPKISVSDLHLLIDTLGVQSNGRYDNLIALWVLSGLLTGLKPSGWRDAYIDNDSLVIKSTRKNKDDARNHFSRIALKKDKPNDTITISGFVSELTVINLTKTDFADVLDCCRRRLYVINKKLWPDRNEVISLYSVRSQFSYAAIMSTGKFGAALLYKG